MRTTMLSAALLLAPCLVAAQSTGSGGADGRSEATATAGGKSTAALGAGFSAETKAKLEAMLDAARAQHLPTGAMLNLAAEGQVKGAAEARIVSALAEAMGRLELAQDALIRAGRDQASDEEITRGASVVARGVSSTQLEVLVRRAPAERSLVVAFEVLAELAARGLPLDQALARIGGRLEARASDVQLRALTGSATADAHATSGLGLDVGIGGKGSETRGSVAGSLTTGLGLGVGLGRKP